MCSACRCRLTRALHLPASHTTTTGLVWRAQMVAETGHHNEAYLRSLVLDEGAMQALDKQRSELASKADVSTAVQQLMHGPLASNLVTAINTVSDVRSAQCLLRCCRRLTAATPRCLPRCALIVRRLLRAATARRGVQSLRSTWCPRTCGWHTCTSSSTTSTRRLRCVPEALPVLSQQRCCARLD